MIITKNIPPGKNVGNYKIVSAIGASGMGDFYPPSDPKIACDQTR